MSVHDLSRHEALKYRIDRDAVQQEAEEFHGAAIKKSIIGRAIDLARKSPSTFGSQSLNDPFNQTASILLALASLYELDHDDLLRQARAIKARRLRLTGENPTEIRSAVNA